MSSVPNHSLEDKVPLGMVQSRWLRLRMAALALLKANVYDFEGNFEATGYASLRFLFWPQDYYACYVPVYVDRTVPAVRILVVSQPPVPVLPSKCSAAVLAASGLVHAEGTAAVEHSVLAVGHTAAVGRMVVPEHTVVAGRTVVPDTIVPEHTPVPEHAAVAEYTSVSENTVVAEHAVFDVHKEQTGTHFVHCGCYGPAFAVFAVFAVLTAAPVLAEPWIE